MVLDGSNLSGAKLQGALLMDVSVKDVELSGADVSGADLTGVDVSFARSWTTVTCDQKTVMPPGWECQRRKPTRASKKRRK